MILLPAENATVQTFARRILKPWRAGLLLALLCHSPAFAEWAFFENDGVHGHECVLLTKEGNTVFSIKQDGKHRADGVVAILVINVKWSIKKGDDLGEIAFHSSQDILAGEPVAGDKGFFFYVDTDGMTDWVKRLDATGFTMVRNGQEIGKYEASDLKEKFATMRRCAEQSYQEDPFAH